METLESINARIEELKALRGDLVQAENVARKAMIDAVPIQWVWCVEWISDAVVRIEKRWSDATIEAFEKLGHKASSFSDWTKPQGMKHILGADNRLYFYGGGHVIIKDDLTGNLHNRGITLSKDEIMQLKSLVVPERIKS